MPQKGLKIELIKDFKLDLSPLRYLRRRYYDVPVRPLSLLLLRLTHPSAQWTLTTASEKEETPPTSSLLSSDVVVRFGSDKTVVSPLKVASRASLRLV